MKRSPTSVQVVLDAPSAKIAVWISRQRAGLAVIRPTYVSDRPNAAAEHVRLELGAQVSIVQEIGEWSKVALTDDTVSAVGWIPKSAIGTIWRGNASGTLPRDVANAAVVSGVAIRAAPTSTAPEVARTRSVTLVRRMATAGGWIEIYIHSEGVHIRGYVEEHQLTIIDDWKGTVATPDTSSAVEVGGARIPRGACLFAAYDAADGVIGVVTLDTVLGTSPFLPGWWQVSIPTHIGPIDLLVHDLKKATNPRDSEWEVCGSVGAASAARGR